MTLTAYRKAFSSAGLYLANCYFLLLCFLRDNEIVFPIYKMMAVVT